MRSTKTPVHPLPLALCGVLLLGCARNWNVPVQKITVYPTMEKIPLAVDLRISEEYRNAGWKGGDRMIRINAPVGPLLVVNTEACARAAFAEVYPNSQPGAAPPVAGAVAVLTPRVANLDIVAQGSWHTSLTLEWSLCDQAGKLIWRDTFKAENRKWGDALDVLNLTLAQVFEQSCKAMASSSEIRSFAERLNAK